MEIDLFGWRSGANDNELRRSKEERKQTRKRIEFSYSFLVEDEYEYKESRGVSCDEVL